MIKIKDFHQCKLNLLKQLYDLTTEQLRLLDTGEYEQMLGLFKDKDTVIQRIDKLDRQLCTHHNPKELLVKLKELQELNKQLEEKLRNTKSALGMKLIELQQGKQTENKYHQFTQTEGAFIDKKQ